MVPPLGGPPRGPWSFPGVPWCPRVLEKISKIPKNYIKNIHAKKYPKLYSQHPFWGTWMPWGGPGGSKSSKGVRSGFFAPNQKVLNGKPVCIYPMNIARVVRFQNFEISTLSPPPNNGSPLNLAVLSEWVRLYQPIIWWKIQEIYMRTFRF